MNDINAFLKEHYLIPEHLLSTANMAYERIQPVISAIDKKVFYNQLKVLHAFHEEGVREGDLTGTTGYGYHDTGRDRLDRIWARVFKCEAALVRWQIVSGTQALSLAIMANCKQGDLVVVLGQPYDTLRPVFGSGNGDGALGSMGVRVQFVNPSGWDNAAISDLFSLDANIRAKIVADIPKNTRWFFLQRSRGYSLQPALSIYDIKAIVQEVKVNMPSISIMVDNCYGEFVEELEPTEVGADLIAGSLIKNPGGGIALTGGYIAGNKVCVERAAERLTSPGLGSHVGPTLGLTRTFLQGFFLAPTLVGEALKGMTFASSFWDLLRYKVFPSYEEHRTDIIQGVILGSKERVLAFCRGIQRAGPVDSMVKPEGWGMPGYNDEVVMAGGTFIQGGSLELSCDAPLREPYVVYLQGGLTFIQGKLGCLFSAIELEKIIL